MRPFLRLDRHFRQAYLSLIFMILVFPASWGEAQEPSAQVRDSAGISIVMNADASSAVRSRWAVSSEHILRIGTLGGEDLTLLAGVTSGTVLPDGRIVLANEHPLEVRIFRADGTPLRAFGGEGEGPGEFQHDITQMRWLGNDSIALLNGRIEVLVYTIDGAFARSIPGPLKHGLFPGTVSWLGADRFFLVRGQAGARTISERGTFRTVVEYSFWAPSSAEVRPLGSVPGLEQYQLRTGLPSFRVPYGRSSESAFCGNRVFIGDTEDYSIARFSWDHGLDLIIRKSEVPLALTDQDRRAGRQEVLSSGIFRTPLPPSVKGELRRGMDAMPLPASHPAFTELLCDSEGLLWVALPANSGATVVYWDVFDRSGILHAVVGLPPGLKVLDIGPDYVLGVSRDDLDVEYVELRRLDRKGGNGER
jgi:hypothetical protein